MTSYTLVTNSEQLTGRCADLAKLPVIGLDTETTSLDPREGRLRLVQLADSPDHAYIIDIDRFGNNGALDPLRRLLEEERPIKVLHNAKFDFQFLRHHLGATIRRPWDTTL